MIAHPPCTYLANSGNMHLYTQPDREAKAQQAAAFFRALHEVPAERVKGVCVVPCGSVEAFDRVLHNELPVLIPG